METINKPANYLEPLLIFFGGFAVWIVAPIVGLIASPILPEILSNFLFFHPQTIWPYGQIAPIGSPQFDFIPNRIQILLATIEWGLVIAAFLFLTYKFGKRGKFITALATIAAVGYLNSHFVSAFGYMIVLDGP